MARPGKDIFIFPGTFAGIESLVGKHDSRLVQQRKHRKVGAPDVQTCDLCPYLQICWQLTMSANTPCDTHEMDTKLNNNHTRTKLRKAMFSVVSVCLSGRWGSCRVWEMRVIPCTTRAPTPLYRGPYPCWTSLHSTPPPQICTL